jgi:D-alanine-D-alanine ligase
MAQKERKAIQGVIMKVYVLGGGSSTEREVSLRSAKAVADALKEAGCTVVELDPANGLADLDDADGVVFPILHGTGGEDGVIQVELEKRNLPYLGSDSQVSAVCFDKIKTRDVLAAAGLPVAQGSAVSKDDYTVHPLSKVPHVLKVSRGGSSIGTYIVRNPKEQNQRKIDEVFALDETAVIEELIEGIEITVPVLDNQALPVFEVIPPEGEEFDYENKYNGKTQEVCPPRSVDEKTWKEAQQLAEKVHKTLGARHLSRTDIIVRPSGEFAVLELNTMPGMTKQSFYPQAAKAAGMTMPELVSRFLDLVKRDYNLSEINK